MYKFSLSTLFVLPVKETTVGHPEDTVLMLNRGDYLLVTNDENYYPLDLKSTTLCMYAGDDDKICFYNKNRLTSDDEED